jgi:hypothetical protein
MTGVVVHIRINQANLLKLPDISSPVFADKGALIHTLNNYIDRLPVPADKENVSLDVWERLALGAERLGTIKEDLRQCAALVSEYSESREPELHHVVDETLSGILGLLAMGVIWGCKFFSARVSFSFLELCAKTPNREVSRLCDREVARLLDDMSEPCYEYDWQNVPVLPDWQPDGQYSAMFAFCRAVGHLTPSNSMITSDEGETDSDGPDVRATAEGMNSWSQDSWEGWQCSTLLVIVHISQSLQNSSGSLAVSTTDINLPNPQKIPFFDIFSDVDEKETFRSGLPLPSVELIAKSAPDQARYLFPFSGGSWNNWFEWRSIELASKICEGEWLGFSTDDFWIDGGDVSSGPMMGIEFRKVDEDLESITVEASDGSDDNGRFLLHGKIMLSTGAFHLRKEYDEDQIFAWDGRMTPLGICGAFEELDILSGSNFGGFWLWKKEWTN